MSTTTATKRQMAGPAGRSAAARNASTEPLLVRAILILLAVAFSIVFLVLPLAAVLKEAFASGIAGYLSALRDPDSISAIRITLIAAAFAVPLNVIFGLAAAWVITKFEFWGKNVLVTLIDLPFAISPVISGMVFVLLFGRTGPFYAWLDQHNIHIVFALPGIVLATVFVTFPFVARELIPLMEAQGNDEETAAVVLGASGWQMFWRVTLPNIKWALLYGIILCNARAMGEFGAVNVVVSEIAGLTCTIPLQIDLDRSSSDYVSAFTLASVLAGLAIVTLVVKKLVEWRTEVMEPE